MNKKSESFWILWNGNQEVNLTEWYTSFKEKPLLDTNEVKTSHKYIPAKKEVRKTLQKERQQLLNIIKISNNLNSK